MRRIASFEVNHDVLERGIYTSRIDGDITTYDIRVKKPNGGDYLQNGAMHTMEHIIATFVRNSEFSDKIIYFGPMGCRTGFYLLVRDMDPNQAIELIVDAFGFTKDFDGIVPGTTAIECGNYLDHDLDGAKTEAAEYLPIIENWTVENLKYKL